MSFVMRDNRGRAIVPGVQVAYNLSGQLALGEVVDTGLANSRYRRANIKVRLLHRAAGHATGHRSNVTNWTNVLVVRDESGRAEI
jgi:hypothetical protein